MQVLAKLFGRFPFLLIRGYQAKLQILFTSNLHTGNLLKIKPTGTFNPLQKLHTSKGIIKKGGKVDIKHVAFHLMKKNYPIWQTESTEFKGNFRNNCLSQTKNPVKHAYNEVPGTGDFASL